MTPTPQDAPATPGPRPAYDPPRITSYTAQQILEQVGPALTCSTGYCPVN
jgi:hypothetical protein